MQGSPVFASGCNEKFTPRLPGNPVIIRVPFFLVRRPENQKQDKTGTTGVPRLKGLELSDSKVECIHSKGA